MVVLRKPQVESALAVQAMKPRIDLLKARFGEDKEKIQKETKLVYEQAGVQPLAGCLPTLASIPIYIGLYRSLSNVSNEGLLDKEGFYWIKSLAGPTSLADRQAGALHLSTSINHHAPNLNSSSMQQPPCNLMSSRRAKPPISRTHFTCHAAV